MRSFPVSATKIPALGADALTPVELIISRAATMTLNPHLMTDMMEVTSLKGAMPQKSAEKGAL
jgi:hypothetical protein